MSNIPGAKQKQQLAVDEEVKKAIGSFSTPATTYCKLWKGYVNLQPLLLSPGSADSRPIYRLILRNISPGSFRLDNFDTNHASTVVDVDFASTISSYQDDQKRVIRITTLPFMAREVLGHYGKKYTHTLPYDLESLFYLIIYYAAGYRRHKRPANGADPLAKWSNGTIRGIQAAKDELISSRGYPFIGLGESAKAIIPVEDETLAYRLWALRNRYKRLHYQIKIDSSAHYSKRSKALRDAISADEEFQARLEGRSKIETMYLVCKRRKELSSQIEDFIGPTNAISFKEWMKGAGVSSDECQAGCNCCEE